MATKPRLFRPPDRSFFLLGPRGTGKTTWLRTLWPDALLLDLLDSSHHRTFSAKPERLYDLVKATHSARPDPQQPMNVLLDEIQQVPKLLNSVHRLIESDIPVRFALTGSSARKLRRSGVNLLGGRASDCRLHPFMAAELGDAFDLNAALERGLLPMVVTSPEPAVALEDFASFYLEQEVRAEGLTRNIEAYSRFLEAMTFSHGAVLNVSGVARDTEARAHTVRGYVEILEDLLLGFRLDVFDRRAKRRLARQPKFFYFDAGIFRAFRPKGPLDLRTELDGAALEGLVAQHLRAWNDYGSGEVDLYTWRTRSGVEVDFVLYGPDEFWGIEVKNTTQVRPRDVRGLRSFGDEYPEARRVLLYRGRRPDVCGGVLCIPVEDFLRRLHPSRSIAEAAQWNAPIP